VTYDEQTKEDESERVNAAVILANWVKKLGDSAYQGEYRYKGEANIRSDKGKEGAHTMLPSLFSAK
jgi:hypothetical protein